jgi:Asp-tRNA(Asn)/Glu-tRNA(Gln) amidotransferase A subunit family amidase
MRVSTCSGFRSDLEDYLTSLGEDAPHRTLASIIESGDFHLSVDARLRRALQDTTERDPERCRLAADRKQRFQEGLRSIMREHRLDAFIYPTWANAPRLIGELATPAGDNNQNLAPPSGFPAITVPMGWIRDGRLPVGLQFLGDAWSEARLIGFAYAWEQTNPVRRAPEF